MKIILLENIAGLGKKFDIKEVKDGYARNFLIPRKLAQAATDSAIKNLERRKTVREKQEKETIAKLTAAAEKIKDIKLEFQLKTGDKGEVFGSVTQKEIEEAIEDIVSPAGLTMSQIKPIKTLGDHEIELDLGKGVKTKITITINAL